MTGPLLAAGFALCGLTVLIDLLAGVGRARWRPVPYLLAVGGCGCLTVVGVLGVTGHGGALGGDLLDVGRPLFRLDPLAGLFLTVCFGVATCVSLVFVSWARPAGRHRGRGLAAGYGLLLVAVAATVLAENAFVFLFGYELLTLAFYVLTAVDRVERRRVPASFLTAVFGKLSGSLVLLGFLLLAADTGSLAFTDWSHVPPGAVHTAAYALIVAGFGAKVGVVPLQVWMPTGYAAAAGPARAAMSGVAMNVGLYGLWRMLGVLGAPPAWLAGLLLVAAGFTALLGIAHAATNPDLNRVVAYSSVENGGLILTGYAVALAGAAAHEERLVALGLLAATLQAVAHAVAKAALFSATATVTSVYRTSNLEELSGVARRLPYSGTAFAVGSVTLAGLPPTIGFVSEWFLLESLLHQFRVHGLGLQLAMAAAGAMLALTVGFAALTFLRLVGLVVLGARHTAPPAAGEDVGLAGRLGLAGLVLGCLLLAAVTPLLIRFIAVGLAPVVPAALTRGALSSPWVLTSVYPHFSVLSPSWLWVTLPIGLLVVFALALLASRGRLVRVRRVPSWHSATAGVSGPDRFTPLAFATPTRHVLANLLRSRHETQVLEEGHAADAHLAYTADVVEVTEGFIYAPALRVLYGVVHIAKRLQSGRLDAYVAYVLIAFVTVLAVVVALA